MHLQMKHPSNTNLIICLFILTSIDLKLVKIIFSILHCEHEIYSHHIGHSIHKSLVFFSKIPIWTQSPLFMIVEQFLDSLIAWGWRNGFILPLHRSTDIILCKYELDIIFPFWFTSFNYTSTIRLNCHTRQSTNCNHHRMQFHSTIFLQGSVPRTSSFSRRWFSPSKGF